MAVSGMIEVFIKCYLCFTCVDIWQSLRTVVKDHLVTLNR